MKLFSLPDEMVLSLDEMVHRSMKLFSLPDEMVLSLDEMILSLDEIVFIG